MTGRTGHAAGRLAALAVAALLGVGLVAGCGGDDGDDAADIPPPTAVTSMEPPPATGDGAPTIVEIPAAADGTLAYDVTEATAPAGEITLSSENPSVVPHNIAIEEPEELEGEVVQQGGVSEITITLPAGSYEYFCSVPGHRQAGMVGTLTVE